MFEKRYASNQGVVINDYIKAAFGVLETTIDDIHSAYKSGQLTARQLVETYLDRIDAYNKQGPRHQRDHHPKSRSS